MLDFRPSKPAAGTEANRRGAAELPPLRHARRFLPGTRAAAPLPAGVNGPSGRGRSQPDAARLHDDPVRIRAAPFLSRRPAAAMPMSRARAAPPRIADRCTRPPRIRPCSGNLNRLDDKPSPASGGVGVDHGKAAESRPEPLPKPARSCKGGRPFGNAGVSGNAGQIGRPTTPLRSRLGSREAKFRKLNVRLLANPGQCANPRPDRCLTEET